MKSGSSRRGFLRSLSLAGVGLIAGCKREEPDKGGLSVPPAEQVKIDENGNLVILDENIKKDLWEIWKGQASKPDPHCSPEDGTPDASCSRKGIHVTFTHTVASEDPNRPPEDRKVNSLCSC